MARIRIELLGGLRVTVDEQRLTSVNTNRLKSLLAFLVLHSDAPQSRERLAYLLWPESSESQARTNLRQLLHHLRRALPVEYSLLSTDNQNVQWRAGSCTTDVAEFEAAAARAEDAERAGHFDTAREALEEAAGLYQDDLLPELYDEWLQPRRAQLRASFADVLSRLTSLLERAGEYGAAIRHATRLIAVDPLREGYYQTVIWLHTRNHDRSSALRVYHECMRTLQRELGVSPDKTTQALFAQALKSEEEAGSPPAPPPSAAERPMPLVGRKTEWEQLRDCWHRVGAGAARFALIGGEPGIGKSRLAEELFTFCHGAGARTRCYLAQGQLAYAPIADWLRAEPLRRARAKLSRAQRAELARVLPETVAENPEAGSPQPLTESWQRLHFYEALNATVRSATKPLLLSIDDLQWCDQDSFEWLHSLFWSGAAEGVLVLGTVRSEETGRDHPLTRLVRDLRESGQISEMLLAPLNAEETAALALQLGSPEQDPEFLERVYGATKGNPLFIVETMRASLHDEGSSPGRVQAVIAGRLARLSGPAYELAGLAAAIGRPFSFDLLAKASDWDEASLSRALEELWERRIIEGRGAESYDYTHDLLRETAYAELNPVRRRSLHRRIARALEELNAANIGGISGSLAAHYEAAGMPTEAIRCYSEAASVASYRFADAEAADLIRRALRLCREFPETAERDAQELELLVMLGPALVRTRGYSMPEVGETYERGLLLARRSGDRKHVFSLLSGAWLFHIVCGHFSQVEILARECAEQARNEGIAALTTAAGFLLGASLFHTGNLERSKEYVEQAMPAYGSGSHPALALFAGPNVEVFCRSYLSHVFCMMGDAQQAEARSREAIALANDLSHPFSLAIALDYAAMLDAFRQDGRQALTRAREALAICRKHGFVYYLAWAEMLTGWAMALEGDAAAGVAQLRRGLESFRASGAELRLPFYYGLLAEAHALGGQRGEALANVASAFAFSSKNGELWYVPELHRLHGDVLRSGGDAAGAAASYRNAVAVARTTGARLFELRAADRLRDLDITRELRSNAAER